MYLYIRPGTNVYVDIDIDLYLCPHMYLSIYRSMCIIAFVSMFISMTSSISHVYILRFIEIKILNWNFWSKRRATGPFLYLSVPITFLCVEGNNLPHADKTKRRTCPACPRGEAGWDAKRWIGEGRWEVGGGEQGHIQFYGLLTGAHGRFIIFWAGPIWGARRANLPCRKRGRQYGICFHKFPRKDDLLA